MEEKEKKPFYKKWWFWVIIAVLVIGGLGSLASSDESDEKSEKKVVETENKKSEDDSEEKKDENKETDESDSESNQDGDSGESDEEDFIKKYETEIVVAADMALERFIADFDISLVPQNWTLAMFDDQNAVIGITEVTWKSVKYQYIYVGTLIFNDEGKVEGAKPHYLQLGDNILGDDGYCNEVFDIIRQMTETE